MTMPTRPPQLRTVLVVRPADPDQIVVMAQRARGILELLIAAHDATEIAAQGSVTRDGLSGVLFALQEQLEAIEDLANRIQPGAATDQVLA